MFKTRVTEKLGIKYPILGGTMMWLSVPKFVAAISNAGALGILASATFPTKQTFHDAVREVKSLTKKPFAVNLNMFPGLRPIPNEEYIEVLLKEGVKIVETSGHKAPEDIIGTLKKAGCVCMHKCVGVRYALKAQSLGVDIVTVVGWENGGATGVLVVATLPLVPWVVDNLKIPVVAGGGVGDGRGLVALLALGAEGVIMGTRFLVTEECPLHPKVKEALVNANETDTMLILRSIGNTHRVWKNKMAETIAAEEAKGTGLEGLIPLIKGENNKKMFESGDLDAGTLACGQAIGLARKVQPVAEAVEEIIAQAIEAKKRLGNIIQ